MQVYDCIRYFFFYCQIVLLTLKNPYAYFELGLLHWNFLFMWEFAVLKCFGAGQKSLNGFPRVLNCCSMLVQSIFFYFLRFSLNLKFGIFAKVSFRKPSWHECSDYRKFLVKSWKCRNRKIRMLLQKCVQSNRWCWSFGAYFHWIMLSFHCSVKFYALN